MTREDYAAVMLFLLKHQERANQEYGQFMTLVEDDAPGYEQQEAQLGAFKAIVDLLIEGANDQFLKGKSK